MYIGYDLRMRERDRSPARNGGVGACAAVGKDVAVGAVGAGGIHAVLLQSIARSGGWGVHEASVDAA